MKNYLVRSDRNNGSLFGDMFDSFFKPAFYETRVGSMKTDIKEDENGYALEIEMPGFKKEEINLAINDGYLSISAEKKEVEEDKKSGYLVRERSCSLSRSYFVGDIDEDDVKAKYENGILSVIIPKEKEKKIEAKKIVIE